MSRSPARKLSLSPNSKTSSAIKKSLSPFSKSLISSALVNEKLPSIKPRSTYLKRASPTNSLNSKKNFANSPIRQLSNSPNRKYSHSPFDKSYFRKLPFSQRSLSPHSKRFRHNSSRSPPKKFAGLSSSPGNDTLISSKRRPMSPCKKLSLSPYSKSLLPRVDKISHIDKESISPYSKRLTSPYKHNSLSKPITSSPPRKHSVSPLRKSSNAAVVKSTRHHSASLSRTDPQALYIKNTLTDNESRSIDTAVKLNYGQSMTSPLDNYSKKINIHRSPINEKSTYHNVSNDVAYKFKGGDSEKKIHSFRSRQSLSPYKKASFENKSGTSNDQNVNIRSHFSAEGSTNLHSFSHNEFKNNPYLVHISDNSETAIDSNYPRKSRSPVKNRHEHPLISDMSQVPREFHNTQINAKPFVGPVGYNHDHNLQKPHKFQESDQLGLKPPGHLFPQNMRNNPTNSYPSGHGVVQHRFSEQPRSNCMSGHSDRDLHASRPGQIELRKNYSVHSKAGFLSSHSECHLDRHDLLNNGSEFHNQSLINNWVAPPNSLGISKNPQISLENRLFDGRIMPQVKPLPFDHLRNPPFRDDRRGPLIHDQLPGPLIHNECRRPLNEDEFCKPSMSDQNCWPQNPVLRRRIQYPDSREPINPDDHRGPPNRDDAHFGSPNPGQSHRGLYNRDNRVLPKNEDLRGPPNRDDGRGPPNRDHSHLPSNRDNSHGPPNRDHSHGPPNRDHGPSNRDHSDGSNNHDHSHGPPSHNDGNGPSNRNERYRPPSRIDRRGPLIPDDHRRLVIQSSYEASYHGTLYGTSNNLSHLKLADQENQGRLKNYNERFGSHSKGNSFGLPNQDQRKSLNSEDQHTPANRDNRHDHENPEDQHGPITQRPFNKEERRRPLNLDDHIRPPVHSRNIHGPNNQLDRSGFHHRDNRRPLQNRVPQCGSSNLDEPVHFLQNNERIKEEKLEYDVNDDHTNKIYQKTASNDAKISEHSKKHFQSLYKKNKAHSGHSHSPSVRSEKPSHKHDHQNADNEDVIDPAEKMSRPKSGDKNLLEVHKKQNKSDKQHEVHCHTDEINYSESKHGQSEHRNERSGNRLARTERKHDQSHGRHNQLGSKHNPSDRRRDQFDGRRELLANDHERSENRCDKRDRYDGRQHSRSVQSSDKRKRSDDRCQNMRESQYDKHRNSSKVESVPKRTTEWEKHGCKSPTANDKKKSPSSSSCRRTKKRPSPMIEKRFSAKTKVHKDKSMDKMKKDNQSDACSEDLGESRKRKQHISKFDLTPADMADLYPACASKPKLESDSVAEQHLTELFSERKGPQTPPMPADIMVSDNATPSLSPSPPKEIETQKNSSKLAQDSVAMEEMDVFDKVESITCDVKGDQNTDLHIARPLENENKIPLKKNVISELDCQDENAKTVQHDPNDSEEIQETSLNSILLEYSAKDDENFSSDHSDEKLESATINSENIAISTNLVVDRTDEESGRHKHVDRAVYHRENYIRVKQNRGRKSRSKHKLDESRYETASEKDYDIKSSTKRHKDRDHSLKKKKDEICNRHIKKRTRERDQSPDEQLPPKTKKKNEQKKKKKKSKVKEESDFETPSKSSKKKKKDKKPKKSKKSKKEKRKHDELQESVERGELIIIHSNFVNLIMHFKSNLVQSQWCTYLRSIFLLSVELTMYVN